MPGTATARLTGVAPVLLVKDVVTSAEYYNSRLGFATEIMVGDPPQFAIVSRDDMRLFLKQADQPAHVVPHWTVSRSTWNVYFWTTDADTLFAELKSRGATIDYDICNQPHGCREFGVRDLDDYDLAFGMLIE